MLTSNFDGSPSVAGISLTAATFGIVSMAIDYGKPSGLVAAISPQEAEQWLGVVIKACGALFAVLNAAVGLWHAGRIVSKHKRRSKPRAKAAQPNTPDQAASGA